MQGALLVVALLVVAVGLVLLAVWQRGRLAALEARFSSLGAAQERTERAVREEISKSREEGGKDARLLRDEVAARLGELGARQGETLERVRGSVEQRLHALQQDNATRLEQMRSTVDDKLQVTLERRLGESFSQVSARLEQVHRGLGEMQKLAAGVGDLTRLMSNVKARGTWGEMQLGQLLELILSPQQFACNVATRAGSKERVEFAIRLPGRTGDADDVVWLPIDCKFPRQEYENLLEAQDRSDPTAVETAGRALEAQLRSYARSVATKYLDPPQTTDFAIVFLPTEGLYAEALRRPGFVDTLQREMRVTLAGPTTLAALLNALQMGFRTLAIEKRTVEFRSLLGAVSSDLAKLEAAIERAGRAVDEARRHAQGTRQRVSRVEQPDEEPELPADGER